MADCQDLVNAVLQIDGTLESELHSMNTNLNLIYNAVLQVDGTLEREFPILKNSVLDISNVLIDVQAIVELIKNETVLSRIALEGIETQMEIINTKLDSLYDVLVLIEVAIVNISESIDNISIDGSNIGIDFTSVVNSIMGVSQGLYATLIDVEGINLANISKNNGVLIEDAIVSQDSNVYFTRDGRMVSTG